MASTSSQVDLDVIHPAVRQGLTEVLPTISRFSVTCVRLDAVGVRREARRYAGTPSFQIDIVP
jgi:hypothetical protein